MLTLSLNAREAVLPSLCADRFFAAKGWPSEVELLLWREMALSVPFTSVVELLAVREGLVGLASSPNALCREAVFSRSLACCVELSAAKVWSPVAEPSPVETLPSLLFASSVELRAARARLISSALASSDALRERENLSTLFACAAEPFAADTEQTSIALQEELFASDVEVFAVGGRLGSPR